MKIITATLNQIEQLVPLFDSYRQFYGESPNLGGARAFLKARFENKESTVFMAFNDKDEALGFTQLYPQFSSVSMKPDYLLNDLFVATRARGKGVGKALLLRAQEFAQANNSKGIMLETAADNPAQHLYEKLGWKNDANTLHYAWLVEI